MTMHKLNAIVNNLKFQNYLFFLGILGNGYYLQVKFLTTDNDNPGVEYWAAGRKWYVSSHATESEVVQTALKAVLTSVEHEAREQFLYKGKALFGPHLDVNTLLALADQTDHREEAA
jgi:hypothetical protein